MVGEEGPLSVDSDEDGEDGVLLSEGPTELSLPWEGVEDGSLSDGSEGLPSPEGSEGTLSDDSKEGSEEGSEEGSLSGTSDDSTEGSLSIASSEEDWEDVFGGSGLTVEGSS